jgi:ADP-ribosylation factor-binding protein GGA
MCEEESDDSEAVAKLLEINDSIHRTIERYKLMKNGDLEAAQRIPQGTLGTSTGVTKNANNELSLIDFGADPEPTPTPTQSKSQSIEDDLLGLSMQDSGYSQGGGIALGYGANMNIPGPALLSSTLQQSSARAPTPQQAGPSKPNYDAFAALNKPKSPYSPAPTLSQQQAAKSHPEDPFGILGTSSAPNPLYNPASQKQAETKATNGYVIDDDWNFSSALPDDGLPSSSTITVSQKEIGIVFNVSRRTTDESVIEILAKFSNRSPNLITEFTFQVAVTKVSLDYFNRTGANKLRRIH